MKTRFSRVTYNNMFLSHKTYFLYAHYLMSSHRLEIEAGRWARPNRISIDQRLCSTCEKLEDDYHFVLECILYKDLRKRYIVTTEWSGAADTICQDGTAHNGIKIKRKLSSSNKLYFTKHRFQAFNV